MSIRMEQAFPSNLLWVNLSKEVTWKRVFLSLLSFVQLCYDYGGEEVWKSTAVLMFPVSVISGVKHTGWMLMVHYIPEHTDI